MGHYSRSAKRDSHRVTRYVPRAVKLPLIHCVMVIAFTICITHSAAASLIVSDGSDGAFSGGGTLNLDADGIFNFTTITVPLGATLGFNGNATNTPVVLAATGDVIIDGTIDVSAGNYSGAPGPGGGHGGANGVGAQPGTDGLGLRPGLGGPFMVPNPGAAGGGGGMATPGLVASARSNAFAAPGGGTIGFPGPVGGSGGGGGSGWVFFGVQLEGGVGGGGGGGLLVTTPASIIVNGTILANGGHGGWSFANIFGFGGPGGGGSGGNVLLEANAIALGPNALIQSRGGFGGGLSTEPVPNDPFFFSSGANGGQGFVFLSTPSRDIAPGAIIDGVAVPLPAGIWLAATAFVGLGCWRRRAA